MGFKFDEKSANEINEIFNLNEFHKSTSDELKSNQKSC